MSIQAARVVMRRWYADPDPIKAIVEELNSTKFGEVAVNPPNILAGARADVVVALPAGTAPLGTELVFVQPNNALEAGLVCQKAWISAANQLTVTVYNPTAGAIDGANLLWTYYVCAAKQINT